MTIDKKAYLAYRRQQFKEILAIKDKLYQGVLLICLLDSLSAFKYPDLKRENRKRFTKFVENYGNWQDATRVSITKLKELLEINSVNKDTLNAYVKDTMDKINAMKGRLLNVAEVDCFYDELFPKCNDEEKEDIFYAKMSNILYEVRNVLAHEFREGDKFEGFILKEKEDAFYYGWLSLSEPGKHSWEINIGLQTIIQIVNYSLDNLEKE